MRRCRPRRRGPSRRCPQRCRRSAAGAGTPLPRPRRRRPGSTRYTSGSRARDATTSPATTRGHGARRAVSPTATLPALPRCAKRGGRRLMTPAMGDVRPTGRRPPGAARAFPRDRTGPRGRGRGSRSRPAGVALRRRSRRRSAGTRSVSVAKYAWPSAESRKSTNACAAAGFFEVVRTPAPATFTSAPGSPAGRKWLATGKSAPAR